MKFKVRLQENWKIIVFLILLVCLAYGNSLKGDFVSDDRGIVRDMQLDKTSFIFKEPSAFLRPLLYFSVNKLFGLNPPAFRLINILFHLGTVLCVYFLLSYLNNTRVALFAASILAVHPIQSESISWISGGTYSQCSFFLMLALLTYVLSLRNKPLFFVSFASFVLALFSNAQCVVFPLIIFLFTICFDSLRKNWKKLLPYFAVDGIWVFIYLFKIPTRITVLQTSYYQKPTMLNPFQQIPIAVTSYLELMFWPQGLTLYHSEMVFTQVEYSVRVAVFIIFLGLMVYSFKRNRQVFFWLSFFLISLLPFLTPFGISWIVAERYVYLGAIGIFVIVALALTKIGEIRKLRVAVNILFCLIVLALAARTFTRNIEWRNEDNLWLATARTSPSSPNTHNNLGDVYSRHGDLERAAKEFQIAIQIKPGYADAYHNLAYTYHQMGRLEEAIENYQQAIDFNPNLWQSHQNLAGIYFEQKKFDLARDNLEAAVKVNPVNPILHSNLGIAYLTLGQRNKARESFRQALKLDPDAKIAQTGLRLLDSASGATNVLKM